MIGLDNSGKSTLFALLKDEDNKNTNPTPGAPGATFTFSNFTINIYDLGGARPIRDYCKFYYDNLNAIIYVVDTFDEGRYSESKECLQEVLKDEKLNNLPLLIFCNKCDLKNSKSQLDKIKKKFDFIENSKRPWKFGLGSGLKGINIQENLLWIFKQIFQE